MLLKKIIKIPDEMIIKSSQSSIKKGETIGAIIGLVIGLFICYYITIYDLSLNFIFYGVSFCLLATGLGLWMCMLGPDWKKQI